MPRVPVSVLLSQSLKTWICLLRFPDYPFPCWTNRKAGGAPDPVKARQGIQLLLFQVEGFCRFRGWRKGKALFPCPRKGEQSDGV